MRSSLLPFVILAQAGIQKLRTPVTETLRLWIPAFAGMTR